MKYLWISTFIFTTLVKFLKFYKKTIVKIPYTLEISPEDTQYIFFSAVCESILHPVTEKKLLEDIEKVRFVDDSVIMRPPKKVRR